MDREERRKLLKCKIYPYGSSGSYVFVVVCSRYKDKWVLSRHRKRDTWETQGGHIEPGELPMETARRELFEESGIQNADIYPVCDYLGYDDEGSAMGMVFLAMVHELGELPESEMKEIRTFEGLPDNLTYPMVTPVLMTEALKCALSLEGGKQ